MKILFTLIKFRNLYRVFKSFLSEISTAATVQGCIFKMYRNFTYEVVGQRRKLKAVKKIVAQKHF
jgi:hypothetical protein